jgi:ATP-dependent Clp protease protease subunit
VSIDDTFNDINVEKWSKQLSKLTSNPIYLYIDSPGGNVDSGLDFINNMNWYMFQQGKMINCIVKSAYSMAFIILQHCSNRYVMTSSTLMQHQMSLSNIKGPINNLMNYLSMIKSISNELDQKVSQRLNISVKEYRNKISNDWWLTGNDAIESSVADLMVTVGCDPELYDIYTKEEELVLDIDSDGNLEFKKITNSKDQCPF